MRGKIKTSSLSSYLVRVSTIVSIVSSITISILLYHSVENYLKNQNIHYAIDNTTQAANTIERELTKVNNMLHSIATDNTIITQLKTQNDSASEGYGKFQSSNQLKEYLFLLSNESNYIEDIIILTDRNQFSSSNLILNFNFNGLRLSPLANTNHFFTLRDYFANVSSSKLTKAEINLLEEPQLNNRFFYATNIIDSNSMYHGHLLITINHDSLISNLLNSPNYRVTHRGNQTLAQGENFENIILDSNIDSEYNIFDDFLVFSETILPYPLNLEYQMSRFKNINLEIMLVIILAVTLLVSFIASILAKFTARSVLKPVNDLLVWMNQQKSSSKKLTYPKDNVPIFGFRRRIQLYFLITILLPFFTVSLIFYLITLNTVSQEVIALSRSQHDSKTILLNEEINKVQKVLASYSANLNLASPNETASFDNLVSYIDSDSTLSRIEYLALYGPTGDLLVTTNNSSPSKLDLYLLNNVNNPYRFSIIPLATEQTGGLIAIRSPQTSQANSGSTDNVLVIKLTDEFFFNLPLIEEAKFEVITFNDSTMWNLTSSLDVPATLDSTYTFKTDLMINDMVFSSVYDMSTVRSDINQLFFDNTFLLIILVLIIIILSQSLSNRVVRPFSRILMFINSSTRDVPSSTLDWQTDIDEIDELHQNFTNSVQRLNQLTDERIENQKHSLQNEYERRELQLLALQNQVNPHFLYNSLDNLLFLVESGDVDRSAMMVSSLSHFFRFITNRAHTIIPIQEEIAFTKRYIEIMKVRFDNFEVEWLVDPDILSGFMMKLTLQPLVENAIQHAAARTDDLVKIEVKINGDGNCINILISDNGRGIAPDKLDYIRNELKHSSYNKSGLFNVRDRLELYYRDFVLNIQSQVDVGTYVNILIPQTKSTEDFDA